MPVVPALPLAITKGVTIGKSIFSFGKSIFGGQKTVPEKFSISQEFFDKRFERGATFRKLWRRNYFLEDGASEIPVGLTVEDLHEQLFGERISQAERSANLYKYGLGRGTALTTSTTLNTNTINDFVAQDTKQSTIQAGFNMKTILFGVGGLAILALVAMRLK